MKSQLSLIACIASLGVTPGFGAPKENPAAAPKMTIVLKSEVEWTHLNPMAGMLYRVVPLQ